MSKYYFGYVIVDNKRIGVFGWDCKILDCDIIFHGERGEIFYYYKKENKLIECQDFWYLWKIKRIGWCHEVKDFKIEIEKVIKT